jgi:hypothetical protein
MKFKSDVVEQITIQVKNRPGVLADLCAHLSDHRINVRAMAAVDPSETGSVRLVVNDTEVAKRTLDQVELPFTSETCLAVEMPNTPGGLVGIARGLSLASGLAGSATALGIFGVSDLDRALALDWED